MPLDLLSVSSTFMTPNYLSPSSAWLGHIPFAFTIIELAKPRTLVELGTAGGDSYMAFCQAVHRLQLPTHCSAIDTWKGDRHAGYYGDQVLAQLKPAHDRLYSRFSRLVQSTFDDALPTFQDGSIDLLHIDGLHTYEAVRHDYETWLPKMSTRGVILFHDTAIAGFGFGVKQLFGEISKGRPSFEFHHSAGLGVLAVGTEVPQAVLDFLQAAADGGEQVRRMYAHLGESVSSTHLVVAALTGALRTQELINQACMARRLPIEAWARDGELLRSNPADYFTRQGKALQDLLSKK